MKKGQVFGFVDKLPNNDEEIVTMVTPIGSRCFRAKLKMVTGRQLIDGTNCVVKSLPGQKPMVLRFLLEDGNLIEMIRE